MALKAEFEDNPIGVLGVERTDKIPLLFRVPGAEILSLKEIARYC
jgi:hypothetical protein